MLEVSFPMANVPRSHLSTAAISCLSTAYPQFIIFPSKLRDYWNAKLSLPRYHSLPFWYDYKISFCLFAHFPAAFSSFHDLTCSSVTPDYRGWVPAVLWGTKQELLLNSVRDEENGSYLWFAFQKMYGRVQGFCQSLKIKGKKKEFEGKCVKWECEDWVLEPELYPSAAGRSFAFELSRSKMGPTQVSWYCPKIRNFWQKVHAAIEFFWRTDFLCTPQYMVLG